MEINHELTLRDIVKVFFRHKLVFVFVTIVLMTATYIGVELRVPRFKSTVTILVLGRMQKDIEYSKQVGEGSLLETQRVMMQSERVRERTVRALRLDQRPFDHGKEFASDLQKIFINRQAEELQRKLQSLTSDERENFLMNRAMGILSNNIFTMPMGDGVSMFTLSYTDVTPREAAIIANVLSRAFVIFDIEQQIAELQLTYGEKNTTIVKLRNHIKNLEESLDGRQLKKFEGLGPASVKIMSQASLGMKLPQKPSKSTALVIAFIISCILSGVLSFVFDYLDQTFKSPQEVVEFLNIRLLGSIPRKKSEDKLLVEYSYPVTKYAESIHKVSEHMYLLMKDNKLKSLLITNAEALEENAGIIANIGIYISQKTDNRVLIIDANIRETDTVSEIFNISDTIGLTDVIQRKISFEDAILSLDTNLYCLPAGNTVLDKIPLIESLEMSDLLKRAKEHYDIVLINCADLKYFKDAVVLSSSVDGTALVISEGKVRRQIVKNAIISLVQKKANIVGAIVCNRRYVIPEIIYRLT